MRRETYGGSGCAFVKMLRLDEHKTVVLAVHSAGRWPQCGIPFDLEWAAAVRPRDGKIGRVDVHGDFSKALKVVGLEP
jgi:hypothetical protein